MVVRARTLLVFGGVLCALFACARCFNVDIENFVKHTGNAGSMFGFSVAQHVDRGVSWVLVGAPEAQTRQPGVTRGGSVFRCDVTRDDACQEVPFDVTGHNNNSKGDQIDRKSEQWFGATVSSSGTDGVIVACAPRYMWFATSGGQREPVGTCYVARNSFSDYSEYSPCRTRNWGHHRQGSCQVGLGAAISRDGERLYLGAVGAWYWQGQIHSVPSDVRLRYFPPGREDFGTPGQVFSQSLSVRPQFYQTREGPAEDDDSYLGYSVVAGSFDGSGEPGVAVGMPKGNFLEGKVVLFTWDLKNPQNISGEQVGGYFGYSLCTSDVDGDGLDDLIIGAPMFTAQTNNNEMKYETGRVYVIYQGTEDKFGAKHTRDGLNSKGRFGLSLAGLGDINKDGYGDFAVGAPYDGPSERGVVYIYHGSKDGVMEKYSQAIFAEDIRPDISTFGFSLAGGLDLDNNAYPDVVVGAYESETAVFLKSRPVIKVNISLDFQVDSKVISLKQRNCTTRDKTRVTCFTLRGCLEYSGEGVDRNLDFEIQFLLDSRKTRDIRLFFLTHEGRYSQNYTIPLEKGRRYCKSEIVYIKSSIRDKLTPLEAELRYGLRSDSARGSVSTDSRRVSRSLKPILDQNVAAARKDSVNIEKNCGTDNICIPDLKLIVRPSVDQYLLGSGEPFEIDVIVENNGEDAFEAMYTLWLPPGMNFTQVKPIDDIEQEIPIQWSGPSPANNHTLRCDIGNPLPKRKVVHFKVFMTAFHRKGMRSRYEFYMEVNTTNPENKTSTHDNVRSLSIPIWVQTDHLVSGASYPSDIPYNMSQYRSTNITRESEVGPQVVHVYTIKNQGPSDIVEAEAYFVWPSHTQEDEQLLYLLEQPQTNGHIRCERINANALKLQLDARNKKNYLQLHGITTDSSFYSGEQLTSSSSSSFSSSSSSSSSFSSSSGTSSSSSSSSSSGGRGSSGSHETSSVRYDRNFVSGGGHRTLTDEERNALDRDSEERHSGRRVHGSGSATSSHSSSTGRVGEHGGEGGYSYEHNRTVEYERQGGGGVRQGGGRVAVQGGGDVARSQGGRVQGSAVTEGNDYLRGGGGRVTTSSQDGRESSGQGGYISRTSQSGREYDSRGGAYGSRDRDNEERYSHSSSSQGGVSQGGRDNDRRYSQTGGRTETHGSIPEEEGTYLGSRVGSHGRTRLEEDYKTFEGHSSQGEEDRYLSREREREQQEREQREHEEWRRVQASQAEWRANQGRRPVTTNYDGHGSQTYNQGGSHSREETRTYHQGGRDGDEYSASRTHSQGRDGDYDGGHYRGSGSDGHHHESSSGRSSSSSRTYTQGGSGDYSAGGTVISNHGVGTIHEDYGHRGSNDNLGGNGERTNYESRNFTATYSENGGAPRHFSNYSFSNSSSGGDNVSGSWQTGDDFNLNEHLGHVSAGHSGSHESVSRTSSRTNYGDARENHGGSGVSRSGYNVGNPSSAERRNWSEERRSHAGGSGGAAGGEGLAVFNWTNPVDGFGQHRTGGQRRTEGRHSQEDSRQWEERDEYYDRRDEPGLRRSHSRRQSAGGSAGYDDRVHKTHSKGESSASEISSSKTHHEGAFQSKDIMGINSIHDVDSRFQLYNRFERSVRDLIDLNKRPYEDIQLRRRRSIEDNDDDNDDSRNRILNEEGYKGESVARQASNAELDRVLECAVPKCSAMKCVVGPLKKGEEAFVGMRYAVWVQTLEKIGRNQAAKLSTLMTVRVTELPHVGEPFEMKLKTVEVPMEVFPTDVPVRPDIVPLWVVVLSACAGAIILLLLIFLLYKCGFFKRNRPSDSAEKEPLNRNGHYNSGDEAL